MDPHVRLSQRPRLPELADGRYGRLFPDLPAHPAAGADLLRYGAAAGPLESRDSGHGLGDDNPRIAAGWPFFGQLIAHDITHDRAPLEEREDLATLQNFRTPRLDLECLYGGGATGQPYLYDRRDPDKLLVGASNSPIGDLPRNAQGVALVGDARDDTHLFISQLHLAFLHFHNRIVDRVRAQRVAPDAVFTRASELVRWHYQWIVVHEFLPLNVGAELTREVLEQGATVCRFAGRPFIPVEFSDAAYRFGHAQIRASYDVNARLRGIPLFPDLVGVCPVTAERRIDWPRLFSFPNAPAPQASRRLGPRLVAPLMRLPEVLVGQPEPAEFASLASRDLYRGHAVQLPSGEAVARAMGVTPVPRSDLRAGRLGSAGETPLWLYVLAEAEQQQTGERLGAVGGRIVGEVLIELLKHDPTSYLSAAPTWQPELANEHGEFGIVELLRYAGVA
jgi:hypothetical protein